MQTNEQIFKKLLEIEAKLNTLLEALADDSETQENKFSLDGEPMPANRSDLQEL